MTILDQPKAVRAGEELDAAKLAAFFRNALPGIDGEIAIEQFPSGFSNLTYLIKVGARELILRRPPHGTKAKTAHDMHREYRILSALKPVFPYCPTPLVYSEDPATMGCSFYVMDRIPGVIPRTNFPKGLTLSPADARRLCENMIDVWVELHAIDYRAIGLGDFGKPEGYVRRQVEGWSQRYRAARTPDAPDCEQVMRWLAANMPPDSAQPTVIHNDYKFDNLILDPQNGLRIVGVLDWEMATIGDPLMDLGCSLGYWVERGDPEPLQMMRRLPTNLEGMLTRRELVARYAEKTGRRVDRFEFYFVFGLFRLGVIAQQIYYRFFHGQTKDERFRMLVFAVKILDDTALAAIAAA